MTLETVKRVPTGNSPSMATYTPDGAHVYVGHTRDQDVVVIDAGTLEEFARIDVGRNPIFLSMLPNGQRVYTSYTQTNNIAVLGTTSLSVQTKITLMDEPPFGFYMVVR